MTMSDSPISDESTTVSTERVVPHTPAALFAAFTDAERLARWWGPAGFTNTFDVCDIRPNGDWKFVMHGPQGANYPNASRFVELTPSRIVIEHISPPPFFLTVDLMAVSGGTRIVWSQKFPTPELAQQIRPFVTQPNEENLDRLVAEVASRK